MTKKQLQVIVKSYDNLLSYKVEYKRIERKELKKHLKNIQKNFKNTKVK
jgi:hypothetical protein